MSGRFPDASLRVEEHEDGALWHVFLDTPKANILDATMVASLRAVFALAAETKDLKAVVIEGAGPHFSFGASVEEHRPREVKGMLRAFHGLFRDMAASAVTVLASVRGQCLGGGLELAAFAHRIFAAPDAKLGQPEIRLGVIAPAASVILPQRVGRAAAEDLCLTGRILDADAAHACGLVEEVVDDPTGAAFAYAREHLLPHSAASLRRAVRAIRLAFDRRLHDDLDAVERLYLDDLMACADAVEGIEAFLEKRKPVWRNA